MRIYHPREDNFCEYHQVDLGYSNDCAYCKKEYAADTRIIPGLSAAVTGKSHFEAWFDVQMVEKEYNQGLLSFEQAIAKRDEVVKAYNDRALQTAAKLRKAELERKKREENRQPWRKIY